MTRALGESRLRGRINGYGASQPYYDHADPPCLVPCPHCTETVIAAHRLYFDNPGQEHRHRPHLGQGHIGVFELRMPNSPE